ncbi:rRNA N6-adenosine-methyltransferase METTL5 [Coccinella septempunctata]|uniref:rRNA N6-adenosine-methyltransferase METTL5 n=1 Tax=Coccinella septempunctata TaxID=41139 RepID=UPI001D0991C2|nr:rRNA N6-adenosine-methyltransferase METTL5 [Coccinella septempunctata]
MKLKQLEYQLSSIEPFKKPKILLEQYVTPPHIAACMLNHIQSENDDITGKIVADLGCGAGCLTIGTAILDAAVVYGFEIDADALEVFQENVEEFEVPQIETLHCDVRKIPSRFDKFFDTVIMNPPFGTKHNAGIDMEFLEIGVRLSNNAVYSLHKTSTRNHVIKHAESLGGKVEVVAELKYNLPSTYKFHKKKSVDIEVDLIKILV